MTHANMGADAILLLVQPGGAGSSHFTIESGTWSHITALSSSGGGTTLGLFGSGTASRPTAVAREHRISDRPGAAESARAIAGVFEVVDYRGRRLATLRKRPLRSIVRTTWEVRLDDGSVVIGRETNPLKTALRRLLLLAELLIDVPIRLQSGFTFRNASATLFTVELARDAENTSKVTVAHHFDERIALLQAALTRTR